MPPRCPIAIRLSVVSACHRKACTTRGFSARLFRLMKRQRHVIIRPLEGRIWTDEGFERSGVHRCCSKVRPRCYLGHIRRAFLGSAYWKTSTYSIMTLIWFDLFAGFHTLNEHGLPPLCGSSLSLTRSIMQDPPFHPPSTFVFLRSVPPPPAAADSSRRYNTWCIPCRLGEHDLYSELQPSRHPL